MPLHPDDKNPSLETNTGELLQASELAARDTKSLAEERLQVIYQLSEAVNRAEAVDQIYELALSGLERVLHVRRAAILLFDQQGVMRIQAWRGLSERYRQLIDGQLPRYINEMNPVPVLIPDINRGTFNGQQQIHLDEGIHAIAFIPLVEQYHLLGKFMLYYDKPHTFSNSEIQWAQTIARHVAHALETRQRETRLQAYIHIIEALNRVQLSLAEAIDLQKLLQMVTDVATALSGAQFGSFFYLQEPGCEAGEMIYALSGASQAVGEEIAQLDVEEILSNTFHDNSIIRLADVSHDEYFRHNWLCTLLGKNHQSLCSYLAVPIFCRNGNVIGGLFFGHSKRSIFTDQAEQLVSGIASQSRITLENARLYIQLKQSEGSLRELNSTLEMRVEQRTEELQRSNRELDQFAYIASHDLKAPLRGINHLATWVLQDTGDVLPAPSQEHLKKLQGRVLRMENLLDDLLAYSRAGRQRHQVEEVDIVSLLRNVVEVSTLPTGFKVNVVSNVPILHVEQIPLETVFRNLIGNAIKHHHNPTQGIVEIQAKMQGNFVEFFVRDNGPGIDPIYHKRIFEMFQTLKPRDQVEGSGVGLAVVKRSIESRGGTISVSSSLGEGATFYFRWPTTPPQSHG